MSTDNSNLSIDQLTQLFSSLLQNQSELTKNLMESQIQSMSGKAQQVMGSVRFPAGWKSFSDLNCAEEQFNVWKLTFKSVLSGELQEILTAGKDSVDQRHNQVLLDAILLGFGSRITDYSDEHLRMSPTKLWKYIEQKFNPTSATAFTSLHAKYADFKFDATTDPEVLFNRLQALVDRLTACGDVITVRSYRQKLMMLTKNYYGPEIKAIEQEIAKASIFRTSSTSESDDEIRKMTILLKGLIQAAWETNGKKASVNLAVNPNASGTASRRDCPHCGKHSKTKPCWVQQGIVCEHCKGCHPAAYCRYGPNATDVAAAKSLKPPVDGATTFPVERKALLNVVVNNNKKVRFMDSSASATTSTAGAVATGKKVTANLVATATRRMVMMVTNDLSTPSGAARTMRSQVLTDGTVNIDPVAYSITAPRGRTYVDSGCSEGMTPDSQLFETYRDLPLSHAAGAGGALVIAGSGTVAYLADVYGENGCERIECETDMLYVPDLPITLFSVTQATKRNCGVNFFPYRE